MRASLPSFNTITTVESYVLTNDCVVETDNMRLTGQHTYHHHHHHRTTSCAKNNVAIYYIFNGIEYVKKPPRIMKLLCTITYNFISRETDRVRETMLTHRDPSYKKTKTLITRSNQIQLSNIYSCLFRTL